MNFSDTAVLLIGFISLFFGILGLFFYLGSKIDSLTNSVYTEMKDFHGRLTELSVRFYDKKEEDKEK